MTPGTAVYSPPLRTAELAEAARAMETAAVLLQQHADTSFAAVRNIADTGFSGPAADAGLARLRGLGEQFLDRSALYHHTSRILTSAGSAQEKLDELADLPVQLHRAQLIEWLNMMAWLLDVTAADAMGMVVLGREAQFTELAHRPAESLEDIHASNLATVPASTAATVAEAGGLILESGPGRTTVIVGDTHDPSRVTTLIGGVSTGRPGKLEGELEKARRIAEETGGAVIVWEGYEPPPDVPGGLNPSAARDGGDKLSAFQHALEDRFPDARKTVLAHSYGTVVAGYAATGAGLYVDDLWLLGSPGVPATSVADMKLLGDNPEVFAVHADADPINSLHYGDRAVHGSSPLHPSFGARVVDGVEGDHSSYFADPDLLGALRTLPSTPPDAGQR